MERRHSTTSDSSTDSRQSSGDGLETGAGRVNKLLGPKPLANPLQFVKVGPCDLYRSAQEQLKKVEEIKKARKVEKDDVEDWQSNLDNWKCSRRKRQEHIIERVVEVKKFEMEEHERNRRKSKTFSEMMQERGSRGFKTSMPLYRGDDEDDLSELGLTSATGPKSDSADTKSEKGSTDLETVKSDEPVEESSDSPKPPSSNESQEYTYEWAIQNYVNFAENRVKSKSTSVLTNGDEPPKKSPPREYPPIPAKPCAKADNYLKSIDKPKEDTQKKTAVPKVDVHRRRELFEKITEEEEKSAKPIKIEGTVKSRLKSITSGVGLKPVEPSPSIKERLSSFPKTEVTVAKATVPEGTVSIKERLNSLQSAISKEPPKTTVTLQTSVNEKAAIFLNKDEDERYSPELGGSGKRHFRHRSLDSLDVDDAVCVPPNNSSFERVQSLEDLDFCRNYPPSTFSGDTTDREDSGIHTADASSSVSQTDDCEHFESHSTPTPIAEEVVEEEDVPTPPSPPTPVRRPPPPVPVQETVLKDEPHMEPTPEPIPESLPEPKQFKGVVVDVYTEKAQDCLFNLSPVAVLEPPKEKPPPPPTETSDDESETPAAPTALRRLDSTKRIKKEIRQKRSSFLGIEGANDESYLEPELDLVRPPDMTAFLTEERRLERQLYRQSVCSESDSNQESRDSGVELDNKNPEPWSHSRNDSEIYGNQSTTSEEDEIMKKEREIIETLEQEEKIRKQDLGEKLAMRLRELEAEKERLEWEQNYRGQEPPAPEYRPDQQYVRPEQYRQEYVPEVKFQQQSYPQELREEVPRRQENGHVQEWTQPAERRMDVHYRKSMTDLRMTTHLAAHRRSMPDLQQDATLAQPRRPPPPPPVQHQPPPSNGPMTRQTLQALSAAPRPRLISNDTWQAKRKQPRQDNYNYQHWLIQEAEHRRITEQQQRQRPVPAQQHFHNGQKYANGTYYGAENWSNQPQVANIQQRPQQKGKPLPDSIIQTLTQRVQRMNSDNNNNSRRRFDGVTTDQSYHHNVPSKADGAKDKMLSVSGKKRCSHCGDELGRGAAMIIESLQLFYHIDCFKCCVCCLQLGDGLMGTDVRVRNNKLHCHNCYSSDDGAKFSCV